MGGGGASFRINLAANKFIVGAKGMYGTGLGRYGNSTLADLTANSAGAFSPIHNLSGLGTIEINPNPRLAIYLNYGGDYAEPRRLGPAGVTTSLGAPSAVFCPSTAGAFTCTKTPTAANFAAGGKWGATWGAPGNPQWAMAHAC